MKKTIFAALLAFTSVVGFGQREKYEATMTELAAKIQNEYQQSIMPEINKMERVANAEAGEWLPAYWVAYGLIKESFLTANAAEKDVILDKAERYLKLAEERSPKNAEIEVLKAYFCTGRLVVDPMARWQKYGSLFEQHLKAAGELDPSNPRVDYLLGSNLFHTPEGFGGGKANAKPYFERALQKFETFKAPHAYAPGWGKMESEYFLGQ